MKFNKSAPEANDEVKSRFSPWDKANLLSKYFIFFMWRLVSYDKRTGKNLEDEVQTSKTIRSKRVVDRLELNYLYYINGERRYRKSILWALFKTFRSELSWHMIFIFISQCVFEPLQIVALGWLIRASSVYIKMKTYEHKGLFSDDDAAVSIAKNTTSIINSHIHGVTTISPTSNKDPFDNFHNEMLIYGGLIIISNWLIEFGSQPYNLMSQMVALKCRIATTGLVYRKALRLNQASLNVATTGRLTNMLSNDLSRFETFLSISNNMIQAPSLVIIVLALLSTSYIGVLPTVAFTVTLLFFTLCQTSMGRAFGLFRQITAVRGDERIRLISELINGIRIIKMYAWEEPLKLLVGEARGREITMLALTSALWAMNFSIFLIADLAATFAAILTYLSLGNIMDAEKLFVTIGLCWLLKMPVMHHLPYLIGQFAELIVGCNRIDEFMRLKEHNTEPEYYSHSPSDTVTRKTPIRHQLTNEGSLSSNQHGLSVDKLHRIHFDRVTAYWLDDSAVDSNKSIGEPILNNLTFTLQQGELSLVVGRVGAGKSSLLLAILGELPILGGNVRVRGELSYCPQQASIFPGTIRENILLEQAYNEDRYHRVLKAASLIRDMELLPYGDETIVGERGISLSGGQKARVNLARALYKEADIYLLDDPLSAVDAPVARDIFRDAIQEFLIAEGKCVVLATHQLQFLQQSNRLIVLERGHAANIGTVDEIYKSKAFKNLGFADQAFEDATSAVSASKIHDDITDDAPANKQREHTKSNYRQTTEEQNMKTSGDWAAFRYYVSCASTPIGLLFFVLLSAANQFVVSYLNVFLSFWSDSVQRRSLEGAHFNPIRFFDHLNQKQLTLIYVGFIVVGFVLALIRTLTFYYGSIRTSVTIHKRFFNAIVNAPVQFFDFNPAGLLLNRLGRDIGHVDQLIPNTLFYCTLTFTEMLGVIVISIYASPWNIISSLVLIILAVLVRKTLADIIIKFKLLEGHRGGPIFTQLSVSLEGLTTIRAFKISKAFEDKFEQLLDMLSAMSSIHVYSYQLLSFSLNLLSRLFITAIVATTLFSFETSSPSIIGLIISQALMIPPPVNWGSRQFVLSCSQMTCVQRITDYCNIIPEASDDYLYSGKAIELSSGKVQSHGVIEFIGVSLRYFHDEAFVLFNLNFTINEGEKVGVVGRTGAGKSSIISTLFRLYDFEGQIKIDGHDTKLMSLQQLRSSISIIPQDPVLFAGSIRKNLDPFSDHTDDELWNALEAVQLRQYFQSSDQKLSHIIQESGSNLSVGQRQLICLARAIIRRNRILVMDEATANVDPETDAFIQKTIRSQFDNCTVITIAHRLITVADSDRVLVLDHGEVIEFDDPYKLLQNKDTLFRRMVESSKEEQTKRLKQVIKEAHKRRHMSR